MAAPPWWQNELPGVVQNRGPMPDVDRLQTLYVKYLGLPEAVVAGPLGWEQAVSRRHLEQKEGREANMLYSQRALPSSVNMKLIEAPAEFCAPVKQDKRLTPAFCVRMEVRSPPGVRLPITMRAQLLTQQQKDNILRWSPEGPATQAKSEKEDKQAKPFTELKGNTLLTHEFSFVDDTQGMGDTEMDASNATAAAAAAVAAASYGVNRMLLPGSTSSMPGDARSPQHTRPLPPGTSSFTGMLGLPGSNDMLGHKQSTTTEDASAAASGNLASMMLHLNQAAGNSREWQRSQQLQSGGSWLAGQNVAGGAFSQGQWMDELGWSETSPQGLLVSNGGAEGLGLDQMLIQATNIDAPGGDADKGMSQPGGMENSQSQQAQQPMLMDLLQRQSVAGGLSINTGTGQPPGLAWPPGSGHQQVQKAQGFQLGSNDMPSTATSSAGGATAGELRPSAPLQTQSHIFEFTSVELLKPTRMNKVYMVFTCYLLDTELLTLVYHVPTIGICRAEQRQKALQKLGLPQQLLQVLDAAGGHNQMATDFPAQGESSEGGAGGVAGGAGPTGAPRHKRAAGEQWAGKDDDRSFPRISQLEPRASLSVSTSLTGAQSLGAAGLAAGMGRDGAGQQGGTRPQAQAQQGQAHAAGNMDASRPGHMLAHTLSRQAMRDFIQEEYDNACFKRKLTEQDMQALLSQAGFPLDASAEHVTVSDTQWQEFRDHWSLTLALLRKISNLWNMDDPCVISGFDMDRQGTVHALANEPVGTFIVRFSMSQAAALVLACKMPLEVHGVDADGLLHAIIQLEDLAERRVDTWIRDFQGATHVLDVYRQKRVDKRKVFASNYTRLMVVDGPPTGALAQVVVAVPVAGNSTVVSGGGAPSPSPGAHSLPPVLQTQLPGPSSGGSGPLGAMLSQPAHALQLQHLPQQQAQQLASCPASLRQLAQSSHAMSQLPPQALQQALQQHLLQQQQHMLQSTDLQGQQLGPQAQMQLQLQMQLQQQQRQQQQQQVVGQQALQTSTDGNDVLRAYMLSQGMTFQPAFGVGGQTGQNKAI